MKNKNVAGRGRPFTQIASTALLLPLLLANARAADVPVESKPGPADPVDIEVFEGARPVKAPGEWAYPFSEKKHHREGWVLLNMMIDPKGKPYEVRVLDSSGNRVLDSAAVKAVNDMAFQPGKNGGTPIDSSLTFKMAFYLKGEARGASREFVAAYTSFSKALDAGDKAQADAELRKVQVENLYEDAFKSYAQYLYDRKWGTDAEQLADLRRALAGDKDGQYLPKELFARALLSELALEMKAKEYGDALYTWRILQPVAPDGVRGELQKTFEQLRALRDSDQVISTAGSIHGTSWNGVLFKSHFAIGVKNGAVSEIKLRCLKKYVFFKYQPDIQYTVNPRVGQCGIEVVGDPGTTFDLIQ